MACDSGKLVFFCLKVDFFSHRVCSKLQFKQEQKIKSLPKKYLGYFSQKSLEGMAFSRAELFVLVYDVLLMKLDDFSLSFARFPNFFTFVE